MTKPEPRAAAPVGEPVAWQRRQGSGDEWVCCDEDDVAFYRSRGQQARPLFASPPVPVTVEETQIEYAVHDAEGWVASSSSAADAEHYAAMYGQDGPVKRKTEITLQFDGFLDRAAIDRALANMEEGTCEQNPPPIVTIGPDCEPRVMVEGRT
jgi:hypothetical protein